MSWFHILKIIKTMTCKFSIHPHACILCRPTFFLNKINTDKTGGMNFLLVYRITCLSFYRRLTMAYDSLGWLGKLNLDSFLELALKNDQLLVSDFNHNFK